MIIKKVVSIYHLLQNIYVCVCVCVCVFLKKKGGFYLISKDAKSPVTQLVDTF